MATNRCLFGLGFDTTINLLNNFTDDQHNVSAVKFRFRVFPPRYAYDEVSVSVDCTTDPDKFTRVNWVDEVNHLIDMVRSVSTQYRNRDFVFDSIVLNFDHDFCYELYLSVAVDGRVLNANIAYSFGNRRLTSKELATIRSFDDVLSMLPENRP